MPRRCPEFRRTTEPRHPVRLDILAGPRREARRIVPQRLAVERPEDRHGDVAQHRPGDGIAVAACDADQDGHRCEVGPSGVRSGPAARSAAVIQIPSRVGSVGSDAVEPMDDAERLVLGVGQRLMQHPTKSRSLRPGWKSPSAAEPTR